MYRGDGATDKAPGLSIRGRVDRQPMYTAKPRHPDNIPRTALRVPEGDWVAIAAWKGTVAVRLGNAGPGCSTVGGPGDATNVEWALRHSTRVVIGHDDSATVGRHKAFALCDMRERFGTGDDNAVHPSIALRRGPRTGGARRPDRPGGLPTGVVEEITTI